MPISAVSGQFVATSGTSATAITGTLPNPPTQGNLLVAMVDCAGLVTPTATGAWVKLTQIQSTDTGALFWKIVPASDTALQTLTSAGTGSSWGVVIQEFAGATSTPLLVQNNQASTTTSKVSPSVSPTASLEALIVGGAFSDGVRTFSSSAFTGSGVGAVTNVGTGSRGSANAGESATLWYAQISSTSGAYTATVTCSAADGGGAAVAVFQAAPPASTATAALRSAARGALSAVTARLSTLIGRATLSAATVAVAVESQPRRAIVTWAQLYVPVATGTTTTVRLSGSGSLAAVAAKASSTSVTIGATASGATVGAKGGVTAPSVQASAALSTAGVKAAASSPILAASASDSVVATRASSTSAILRATLSDVVVATATAAPATTGTGLGTAGASGATSGAKASATAVTLSAAGQGAASATKAATASVTDTATGSLTDTASKASTSDVTLAGSISAAVLATAVVPGASTGTAELHATASATSSATHASETSVVMTAGGRGATTVAAVEPPIVVFPGISGAPVRPPIELAGVAMVTAPVGQARAVGALELAGAGTGAAPAGQIVATSATGAAGRLQVTGPPPGETSGRAQIGARARRISEAHGRTGVATGAAAVALAGTISETLPAPTASGAATLRLNGLGRVASPAAVASPAGLLSTRLNGLGAVTAPPTGRAVGRAAQIVSATGTATAPGSQVRALARRTFDDNATALALLGIEADDDALTLV